jgi:hypothetical protein
VGRAAPPNLSVNPTRTYALMSDAERYPSIADVSASVSVEMRELPPTFGLADVHTHFFRPERDFGPSLRADMARCLPSN